MFYHFSFSSCFGHQRLICIHQATRTIIARQLKGLEDFVSVSSVHWHMGEKGWRFPTAEDKDAEGVNVVPDPLHDGFTHIRQVYFESEPNYEGRFTVPVLYDKKQKTIVSNESSEIVRMFYTEVSFVTQQVSSDFDDLFLICSHQNKYSSTTFSPRNTAPSTCTRPSCRRRSTRPTSGSTTRSTTACTSPASPPRRRRTSAMSRRCLRRWTRPRRTWLRRGARFGLGVS